MVALECPVVINGFENSLGIKKSKKKKKEKHPENHGDLRSIDVSNNIGIKDLVNEEDQLIKKKKHKKKHRHDHVIKEYKNGDEMEEGKSKKEKHKKKKHNRELQAVTENDPSCDQNIFNDEIKKRKREYVEASLDEEKAEENDDYKPKKKKDKKSKSGVEAEVPKQHTKKHKKKKNKKTKELKENSGIITTDMIANVSPRGSAQNNGETANLLLGDKKKKDSSQNSASVNNAVENGKGTIGIQSEGCGIKTNCLEESSMKDDRSPFKKDFYSSSYSSATHDKEKELLAAEQYRKEHSITIYGKGKSDGQFHPIRNFRQLGFEQNLMTSVQNFKEPTPIQSSSWPVIATGRDTIGIAETGSGKTLAFTIPALAHLRYRLDKEKESKKQKRQGPMMLVVAPTRELAQQSQDVLEAAGKACGIRSVAVYGGVSKWMQRESLCPKGNTPYEVVVATPGRLIDLMNESSCDLSSVSYLVLDEADRMLDQGFERDVRKIISATHPHRQTCLFSATWPDSVRELAHEFLKNPIKITIGSDDLTAGSTIEQIVEVIDDDWQRQGKLVELLKQHQKSGKNTGKNSDTKRVLVFVLYKKEATRIESFLAGKGFNVTSIHGDKSQDARQAAVDSFKAGRIPYLVATDVAARGLDIPDVDLVLNFSFPLTIEDYVHRIGRTGRAGKKGTSYTFFQSKVDKLRAGELVKVLRDAGQAVPEKMLTFDLSIRKKEHKLYGSFGPKDYQNVPMKKPTKVVFGDDD